jgi:hypothetical protein
VDRGFGDLGKIPKEALLTTSYYRCDFHPINGKSRRCYILVFLCVRRVSIQN